MGYQLRAIEQGLVIFSQGNKGYYPGIDATGDVVDATVEGRFKMLLDATMFSHEYLISPDEIMLSSMESWKPGTPFTSKNTSYARLQLAGKAGSTGAPTSRLAEWRDTNNNRAVMLSDRNVGKDTRDGARSIHTLKDNKRWIGQMVCNDNHVEWESPHILEFDTKYGNVTTSDDNIFEAAGDSDAYMIHEGK
ncbi:MAG: hypothetical protein K8S99_11990 [Planctomycetes bacterium]|nr:hypothetical protein [Planctomycetota bacterium]